MRLPWFMREGRSLPASRSSYLRDYAAYRCLRCADRVSTTMRREKAPTTIDCACGGACALLILPPQPARRAGEW